MLRKMTDRELAYLAQFKRLFKQQEGRLDFLEMVYTLCQVYNKDTERDIPQHFWNQLCRAVLSTSGEQKIINLINKNISAYLDNSLPKMALRYFHCQNPRAKIDPEFAFILKLLCQYFPEKMVNLDEKIRKQLPDSLDCIAIANEENASFHEGFLALLMCNFAGIPENQKAHVFDKVIARIYQYIKGPVYEQKEFNYHNYIDLLKGLADMDTSSLSEEQKEKIKQVGIAVIKTGNQQGQILIFAHKIVNGESVPQDMPPREEKEEKSPVVALDIALKEKNLPTKIKYLSTILRNMVSLSEEEQKVIVHAVLNDIPPCDSGRDFRQRDFLTLLIEHSEIFVGKSYLKDIVSKAIELLTTKETQHYLCKHEAWHSKAYTSGYMLLKLLTKYYHALGKSQQKEVIRIFNKFLLDEGCSTPIVSYWMELAKTLSTVERQHLVYQKLREMYLQVDPLMTYHKLTILDVTLKMNAFENSLLLQCSNEKSVENVSSRALMA